MALKNINKQLLFVDKCFNISRIDTYTISGCLPNNPNSRYKNKLTFKLIFPKDYPFRPPTFLFDDILFHPNFKGLTLKLPIVEDDWCPVININTLLYSILSIIDNPIFDNSCKYGNEFAAEIWNDIDLFNQVINQVISYHKIGKDKEEVN